MAHKRMSVRYLGFRWTFLNIYELRCSTEIVEATSWFGKVSFKMGDNEYKLIQTANNNSVLWENGVKVGSIGKRNYSWDISYCQSSFCGILRKATITIYSKNARIATCIRRGYCSWVSIYRDQQPVFDPVIAAFLITVMTE